MYGERRPSPLLTHLSPGSRVPRTYLGSARPGSEPGPVRRGGGVGPGPYTLDPHTLTPCTLYPGPGGAGLLDRQAGDGHPGQVMREPLVALSLSLSLSLLSLASLSPPKEEGVAVSLSIIYR